MADTFISYRRDDSAGYAGRLRESLERRLGAARVFRDVDTLVPGQDFVEAIETRLAACQVMIVVIGREWLGARLPSGVRRLDDPYDFVRLEVAAGLKRTGVLVVPVLVEGAEMPMAADLPEDIRALARRHAVSVRDETWDADVDRLAAVIQQTRQRDRRLADWMITALRPTTVAAISAAALAVVASAVWMSKAPPAPAEPASQAAPPAVQGAYTIDIPRVAEAAFGDLVVALVSGNVVPRGGEYELRLRVRMSNGGGTAANFWDEGFRLTAGQETLAPVGGLNEILESHSLRYGIVAFRLPTVPRAASLRIIQSGAGANLPLDLSPTGRPPVDEQAVIEDSLSQAIVRRLIDAPKTLIETGDVRATMTSAVTRRFVNAHRVVLSLRIENRGRSAVGSWVVTLRATGAGVTVAPLQPSSTVIESGTTGSEDVTFDLPPAATRVVLTATIERKATETVFELTP